MRPPSSLSRSRTTPGARGVEPEGLSATVTRSVSDAPSSSVTVNWKVMLVRQGVPNRMNDVVDWLTVVRLAAGPST